MYYEEMSETKIERFPVYYSVTMPPPRETEPPLHWHEELEILYCSVGTAHVVCDNARFILQKGDIAVINPNSLHTLYTTSDCTRYCLLIGQKLLEKLDCLENFYQTQIRDAELANLFESIRNESEQKEEMYQQQILAYAMRILVRLHRQYRQESIPEAQSGNEKMQIVRQMMAYIDRHFAEKISIDTLCGLTNYSRSYIMHAFREVTGSTLLQYIHLKRLYHADSLLATGKYTVNACMDLSGFQSVSYFYRKYREIFGKTPLRKISE